MSVFRPIRSSRRVPSVKHSFCSSYTRQSGCIFVTGCTEWWGTARTVIMPVCHCGHPKMETKGCFMTPVKLSFSPIPAQHNDLNIHMWGSSIGSFTWRPLRWAWLYSNGSSVLTFLFCIWMVCINGWMQNGLYGASLTGFWIWNVFHSNHSSRKGAESLFCPRCWPCWRTWTKCSSSTDQKIDYKPI